MTAVWQCDGPDCTTVIGKDDARLSLAIIKPAEPERDPDDYDDETELNLVIELPSFGFDSDHDFCSTPCLAAWAYREHLAGLPDGQT